MSRKTDRPRMTVIVTANGMRPASHLDAEILSGFRVGAELEVEVHQPKTAGQLKLWWWMLGKVVPNQDAFPTADAMSKAILYELGHFDRMQLLGGGEHRNVRSLGTFDAEGMSELIESAKVYIEGVICPGLSVDKLLAEASKKDRRRL